MCTRSKNRYVLSVKTLTDRSGLHKAYSPIHTGGMRIHRPIATRCTLINLKCNWIPYVCFVEHIKILFVKKNIKHPLDSMYS